MIKTDKAALLSSTAANDTAQRSPRFMRKQAVIDATGVPGSTIYEMMERGAFPKPVRISPRLVAWIEDEILDWQRARIAERNEAPLKPKRAVEAHA